MTEFKVQKILKMKAFQAAARRLEGGGVVDINEMAAELYPDQHRQYAKLLVRTSLNHYRRWLKNKKRIVTFSRDNKVKRAVDSREYRISANRVKERAAEAIDSFAKVIDIATKKHPELLEEFSFSLLRLSNKANTNLLALKSGEEEDEDSANSDK